MQADFSIYASPKVDCHCHILDPARFAYNDTVHYQPGGQETGSADYFAQVQAAYGVRHALLVGPNSGYDLDNRAMLAAIKNGGGRYKGIAVLPNDASVGQLQDLKAQGIVGVAFNFALRGPGFYADIEPLLGRLAALDLFANVQIDGDQMLALAPRLRASGVKILIDHCARPDLTQGILGEGFLATLGLADTGMATVKLSGFSKFSAQDFPFADTQAYTQALLEAFGPQHCIWASDWPFLKAPSRLDYGPLLQLFAASVPEASKRQQILWGNPRALFGFGELDVNQSA